MKRRTDLLIPRALSFGTPLAKLPTWVTPPPAAPFSALPIAPPDSAQSPSLMASGGHHEMTQRHVKEHIRHSHDHLIRENPAMGSMDSSVTEQSLRRGDPRERNSQTADDERENLEDCD